MSLFTQNKNEFIIKCPACRATTKVKKSSIIKMEKRKAMVFKCTCGNRFHKRIVRKNFKEVDIISAIANADIEVLWYKIKWVACFFGQVSGAEKIQLV